MAAPTKVNVARPEAWGYDALIEYGATDAESLYLRLAVGPGRRMDFQTVEPQSRGPQTGENPEDMRPESGETFSRSDFTGGSGLRRAHRRGGTDRDWSRFWDSSGVNIGDALETADTPPLVLSHDTETFATVVNQNAGFRIVNINGRLFAVVSDATRVDTTADPNAATVSWTVEDPHAGETNTRTVDDLAALDDELYAAISNNGVHKRSSAGTWSHWSDAGPTRIWAAKGRLLGQQGVLFQELAAGAGSTTLLTLGGATDIGDVVDAGAVILVGATNGVIYAFAEEGGALTQVGETQMPAGESVQSLAYAYGILLIGTYSGNGDIARLYRGVVVGERITDVQLLKTWGEAGSSTFRFIYSLTVARSSIYFAIVESSTEAAVWRYDIATGGLSRALVFTDTGLDSSGDPLGIGVFDNKIFLRIDTKNFHREVDTYASSGYVITPLADFFTAAKKVWVGARLSTGAMPTGTQITLAYTTDPEAIEDPADASWTTVITATPASPGDDTETAITGVESRWVALKATLTPNGTNTATPELLSVAIRGLPEPTEDDYLIPINVSDQLELPHRKRLKVPNLGETTYDRVKALEGKAVTVTLLRPDESVIGQIRSVSAPIQEIPERGSPTTYALMTVRGQRQ